MRTVEGIPRSSPELLPGETGRRVIHGAALQVAGGENSRSKVPNVVVVSRAEFDAILKSEGVETKKVGPRAPNLNAFAERWVQSVRQECLEHFIVFGEAHLRHILSNYETYYNEERAHQGVGNARLRRFGEKEPPTEIAEGAIHYRQWLGRLLKHYYRQAA